MHKTAATPLALAYTALIVYASLFPFEGWRYQGIPVWAFLSAPMPHYWSTFDVVINVIGYMPFGGLLSLAALRTGRKRFALIRAVLLASALSLAMESLQNFLPTRVASREDWLLNSGGALLGALVVAVFENMGALERWSRIRSSWFVAQSRGALVLLALWPIALLVPPSVPFGLGQVFERGMNALIENLHGAAFLAWFPEPAVDLLPLSEASQMLCVGFGLLVPCLLGFSIIRSVRKRIVFAVLLFAAGVAVTVLSSAMSWGPEHVWAWLDAPSQLGLICAGVIALLLSAAPMRASAALVLLCLGLYLSLLNQAPEGAYFAQTLQNWEQGRFIRFEGLAQWLAWLWPYAVLLLMLRRLWESDSGGYTSAP